MLDDFKISVVIPAFNAEQFIDRSIKSVIRQSYLPFEIIVIDDGSKDRTVEIASSYEKVCCLKQSNAGASASRNRGIFEAKGNWIAFLDADDEWLPKRLELQVELLKRHNELKWVSGQYIVCRRNIERARKQLHPDVIITDGSVEAIKAIALNNALSTCAMLIRRDILLIEKGFNENLEVGEDLDLWFRLGRSHPLIGYVEEPLFCYHRDNVNSLVQQTSLSLNHSRGVADVEKRWNERELYSEKYKLIIEKQCINQLESMALSAVNTGNYHRVSNILEFSRRHEIPLNHSMIKKKMRVPSWIRFFKYTVIRMIHQCFYFLHVKLLQRNPVE